MPGYVEGPADALTAKVETVEAPTSEAESLYTIDGVDALGPGLHDASPAQELADAARDVVEGLEEAGRQSEELTAEIEAGVDRENAEAIASSEIADAALAADVDELAALDGDADNEDADAADDAMAEMVGELDAIADGDDGLGDAFADGGQEAGGDGDGDGGGDAGF